MLEIVREPSYEEDLARLRLTVNRLHDLECAIDWALQRSHAEFDNIESTYYVWKMEELINFPSLRILYHVDMESQRICLINIDVA